MATEFSALSPGQVTFFVLYGWTLSLWLLSELLNWRRSEYEPAASDDPESLAHKERQEGQEMKQLKEETDNDEFAKHESQGNKWATLLSDATGSGLVRCVLLDMEVIRKEQATLKAMAEFGTLMVWYFLCDRTPLMPAGEKEYSRDLFAFLFLILTCVAFGSSLQQIKSPILLSRQQTEEWKGWMQVLFLLYHYFEARELYNAIRIFIAGYVWMTGFGNFSYYYKTGDYCVGRFCQMMWRLNFLVFFVCLVMRNSYMLYYICPMHTIFTIMVYAVLGLAPHWNASTGKLALKMFLALAAVILFWDVKAVFYAIWYPFTWLVGYADPRKPAGDIMHEWFFRSSLDRYVWIYGMLCAWVHPQYSAFIAFVEAQRPLARNSIRAAVIALCSVVGYFWYVHVYCLPKLEYNEVHPYTSWIPITLFIVLRNMTPTLRLHHLRLYGWLGCITLETYIGQFHVWLKTEMPDGQPKALLEVLPGYPLLNFAVVTAGYVFVSYRLFQLTNTLKNVAVPHSNDWLLLRNCLLMAAGGAIFYFSCYIVMTVFVYV